MHAYDMDGEGAGVGKREGGKEGKKERQRETKKHKLRNPTAFIVKGYSSIVF